MDVNEVLLPGVGLRYEFDTSDGDHIGIVALRDGGFLVAVYDPGDPDEPLAQYRLDGDEADAVAQILGAPRMAERLVDLSREVPGLIAGQVEVAAGSRFVDRTLGDTRARTRTGASIVAVVREEEVVVSPDPEQPLRAGDILVVVGTPEGIAGVTEIVAG